MSAAEAQGPFHGRVPRSTVVLVTLAAAVVVVAGLRSAAGILGPAFLALVLTIAVHPVRRRLSRVVPGWLASTACILVVYLAIVTLAISLVVAAERFARLLPEYRATFGELLVDVAELLSDIGIDPGVAVDVLESLDFSSVLAVVSAVLSGTFGMATNVFFILALVLFMIIDAHQFPRLLVTAREGRPELVDALTAFAVSTRQYLKVSTLFGLVVAVLDGIALALLGIPAAVLWALVAFVTNYVPNVGFVIGLVPPAALALLEGGPGLMLAVIAVYSVINVIIQSVIQPKVVGDTVGLSATLTFLSLVFWSWVLGPLGAVLAIPISLLVRTVLIDADPQNRWLGPLVANSRSPREVPAPES